MKKEPLNLENYFFTYTWYAQETTYVLYTEDYLGRKNKGFRTPP